jgi:hypothetical protein
MKYPQNKAGYLDKQTSIDINILILSAKGKLFLKIAVLTRENGCNGPELLFWMPL